MKLNRKSKNIDKIDTVKKDVDSVSSDIDSVKQKNKKKHWFRKWFFGLGKEFSRIMWPTKKSIAYDGLIIIIICGFIIVIFFLLDLIFVK